MESFVRQKGELVTKLINARKEKSKLEQEHQMHAQQLKVIVLPPPSVDVRDPFIRVLASATSDSGALLTFDGFRRDRCK